jgi:S-adenosylmethionine:tRNA ribosyltransferase-isomerase
MKLAEFDFELPLELIAQAPLHDRGGARLLVLDKAEGNIIHSKFSDLGDFLRPDDLLVLNNTKVFTARLLGQRENDRKNFECLLINKILNLSLQRSSSKNWIPDQVRDDAGVWNALINPASKINVDDVIAFQKDNNTLKGKILKKVDSFQVQIELENDNIESVGHIPLPPYIKRPDNEEDKLYYQTIYAKTAGSVAAPTAGLHFTAKLLSELQNKGVEIAEITLHVGYGTFKPVRCENIENHTVDRETYIISPKAAKSINNAILKRRRIIAVGTTTVRCLESACQSGQIQPGENQANIFIYPGFKFTVISGMITNFHLPKSSLLMLVSALAGRDKILDAYSQAVKEKYRFYSYGDAMLIL